MEDIKRTVTCLVQDFRILHPRDQTEALKYVSLALDILEAIYVTSCEEQQWRNPLTIPEVLKNVLRQLNVPDLLNCRLVSHEWSKEATSILHYKGSSKPVLSDTEDVGFDKYTAWNLVTTFEETEKLPFDELKLNFSLMSPKISLAEGFLDLSLEEDQDTTPEEKIDPMMLELANTFGPKIRHLIFMFEEPIFSSKVLDHILQKFPALKSLKLPFTVYPEGEIISRSTLAGLKDLIIVNGVGPIELLWSALRSASELERLTFRKSETFETTIVSQTMLDHFLRIPSPPERKNVLMYLRSLRITCDNQSEFNLFIRLARIQLSTLEEFQFESTNGNFSDDDVQVLLHSISLSLTHLNVTVKEMGNSGPIVPLNSLKLLVANFSVTDLDWVGQYENLQCLDIDASCLSTHATSEFRHPNLRTLKLRNFPLLRESSLLFQSVINCFANITSLEVVACHNCMKIIFRTLRNIESLILYKEASPESFDGKSCSYNGESFEEALTGLPQKIREELLTSQKQPAGDDSSSIDTHREHESWIGNLSKVRKLSVNNLEGVSYTAVAHGISHCRCLQMFSAEKTDITDEALMALADKLTLIHVNIRNCPDISPSTCQYFQMIQPYCYLER